MTIIQMQYFQTVCKLENMTKAALVLHVSQPALSMAMKKLEEECGAALFDPKKKGTPTDEGIILLKEVNLLLNQYKQLQHVIKGASEGIKYIRVGLSTLSGNQVFPILRREFQKRYPEIQVISFERSTEEQFEMLDNGRLDLIITTFRPIKEEIYYKHFSLNETELLFCVGKEHSLADRARVSYEEIAEEQLVLLDDYYNQTKHVKEELKKRRLVPKVIHYTRQMYTIERFVEMNAGCGFLPRYIAEANPKITGLHYRDELPKPVELIWLKDTHLLQGVQKFISLAKEIYPHL